MQFVIDTHGLSKTFRRVEALKALNLSVPQKAIDGRIDETLKLVGLEGYCICGCDTVDV